MSVGSFDRATKVTRHPEFMVIIIRVSKNLLLRIYRTIVLIANMNLPLDNLMAPIHYVLDGYHYGIHHSS